MKRRNDRRGGQGGRSDEEERGTRKKERRGGSSNEEGERKEKEMKNEKVARGCIVDHFGLVSLRQFILSVTPWIFSMSRADSFRARSCVQFESLRAHAL